MMSMLNKTLFKKLLSRRQTGVRALGFVGLPGKSRHLPRGRLGPPRTTRSGTRPSPGHLRKALWKVQLCLQRPSFSPLVGNQEGGNALGAVGIPVGGFLRHVQVSAVYDN